MTILPIVLTIIGVLILIIFSLPIFIMGVLNTGNYIGLLFGGLITFYGAFFKRINQILARIWKNKAGMIALTVTALVLLFMLVFTIVVTAKMANKANVPPKSETTVIVLGCRVRTTGASTMLKTRLKAAYEFLTDHPDVKCVL